MTTSRVSNYLVYGHLEHNSGVTSQKTLGHAGLGQAKTDKLLTGCTHLCIFFVFFSYIISRQTNRHPHWHWLQRKDICDACIAQLLNSHCQDQRTDDREARGTVGGQSLQSTIYCVTPGAGQSYTT